MASRKRCSARPWRATRCPRCAPSSRRPRQRCATLGVAPARIAWDPGIGFGKTVEQNFALLARQRELLADGYPLVAGWSRKSSLGNVTGLPVNERLAPSLAAALLAAERGAHVLRVHDVKETRAALKVRDAMIAADNSKGMESTS